MQPNGVFLVTGPTGSGKTTTLYACLRMLNTIDTKILTAEDPVEFPVEGIVQCHIVEAMGMTFSKALKSFLRQDPDIILVGEMRDLETASIGIEAALTGHLVVSTLHTNSSTEAITRMLDMGVEPFMISSSVNGVLAQRLCRTLCRDCREPYHPTALELEQIGVSADDPRVAKAHFHRAKGCAQCGGSGYAGRMGLHELLVPDEGVKRLVVDKADAGSIKKAALRAGMKTLLMDGAIKAMEGTTTIEEVMRIATAAVD
ncbi:MAG TPA: hypothetical protein DCQ06_13100 [Myxococcales bacterium]|nr:hypothetical protein [Myxococcales bacterium]